MVNPRERNTPGDTQVDLKTRTVLSPEFSLPAFLI